MLTWLILIFLGSFVHANPCLRFLSFRPVSAHQMVVHQHVHWPAMKMDSALTSPEFHTVPMNRIFSDTEARALIESLVNQTGQTTSELPIFDSSDRLSKIIGAHNVRKLQEFVGSAYYTMVARLPFSEQYNQVVSPTQTLLRWSTDTSAVHDEPHFDQTSLTLIKREYHPEFAQGTRLYFDNAEWAADPTQALIISGGLRPLQFRSNGFYSWYQSPGVAHGASPKTTWDLAVFVALQPSQ